MTNNSCGCGHDHDEEEKDTEEHACCGGGSCSSDSEDACGCGHDHAHGPEITPEQLAELKQAIIDAGYQIEETADGEIKVLEA